MCLHRNSQAEPKYFTLEELVHSDTALSKKIENIPSFEIVEHLKELVLFLDGIREAWGGAIFVSSGFRCDTLNKAVVGVSNSIHQIGYAADLVPGNGDLSRFEQFLTDYLKDKDYDQCIRERSGSVRWIHLGLYNNKGEQRRMMIDLEV